MIQVESIPEHTSWRSKTKARLSWVIWVASIILTIKTNDFLFFMLFVTVVATKELIDLRPFQVRAAGVLIYPAIVLVVMGLIDTLFNNVTVSVNKFNVACHVCAAMIGTQLRSKSL